MNETIKRTITAFFMVVAVYFIFKYSSVKVLSGILFLIISIAAAEFLKLSKDNLKSMPIILFNGFLIGCCFTFSFIGLREVIFLSVVFRRVVLVIYITFSEKSNYHHSNNR